MEIYLKIIRQYNRGQVCSGPGAIYLRNNCGSWVWALEIFLKFGKNFTTFIGGSQYGYLKVHYVSGGCFTC